MKRLLHSQAHQWLRHLVRMAVFAFVVAVPVLGIYRNLLAGGDLEDIRNEEIESVPRSIVIKLDAFFHPPGEDLSRARLQTRRDRTLARLELVRGNNWSAEIGDVSLMDPLAGAESVAAGKNFNRTIFLGLLIPVAATLVLGRFFCAWICPAGFLFDTADKVRMILSKLRVPLHNTGLWHGNKFVLLGVGLALAALFSVPLLGFFYPPALVGREIHGIVDSFFGGVADHPARAGAVSLTAASLFLFTLVIVEIFVSRRMWCRCLCPGGALYTILGATRLVRVRNDQAKCTHCTECVKICPMGLNPMTRDTPGPECDQCLACLPACAPGSLSLEFGLPALPFTATPGGAKESGPGRRPGDFAGNRDSSPGGA